MGEPPPLMSYQPDLSKMPAVDKHLVYRGTFLAEIWNCLLHAPGVQYDVFHRDV